MRSFWRRRSSCFGKKATTPRRCRTSPTAWDCAKRACTITSTPRKICSLPFTAAPSRITPSASAPSPPVPGRRRNGSRKPSKPTSNRSSPTPTCSRFTYLKTGRCRRLTGKRCARPAATTASGLKTSSGKASRPASSSRWTPTLPRCSFSAPATGCRSGTRLPEKCLRKRLRVYSRNCCSED